MNRITDYTKTLPIVELYTAVQSEGSRAGMPTIVIRTTGCTHRCWFGEGGWCDSWYTSIHPEKGKYNFNNIIEIYNNNPHIREMMLTGGSPTMHPDLVNELTHFAYSRGIFITIETEGSHFIETDHQIGLVSLSPKFTNSVPRIGVLTPQGKMIDYHYDFHYKPVWDSTEETLAEIEAFRVEMDIPKWKTWVMPAGDTREELIKMYPIVMEMCMNKGYNFTGREHIIAYDTRRCV